MQNREREEYELMPNEMVCPKLKYELRVNDFIVTQEYCRFNCGCWGLWSHSCKYRVKESDLLEYNRTHPKKPK